MEPCWLASTASRQHEVAIQKLLVASLETASDGTGRRHMVAVQKLYKNYIAVQSCTEPT